MFMLLAASNKNNAKNIAHRMKCRKKNLNILYFFFLFFFVRFTKEKLSRIKLESEIENVEKMFG